MTWAAKSRLLFITVLFLHLSLEVYAQDAKWITTDNPEKDEPNTWIEFRKDFDVNRNIRSIETFIAADTKYWLYINDQMVVFEGGLKRGPSPDAGYYDVIDIADYLKVGVNQIRILLWHFGKDGFSHKDSGKSGLIFNAEKIGLVSNSTWQSRKLSAFQTAELPKANYRLPESSLRYDARLADAEEWTSAVEIGSWGDSPWGELKERPIPQWKDFGVRELRYKEWINRDGNRVLSARLPYNMQMTPVIDLTDSSDGTLIRFETDHIKGGSDNCIYAEYITVKGRQLYESLGWMNGDELHVILPSDADVHVHYLGYRETGYDCEFEGSFTCSDPVINTFWQKAMRTLYVNMRDTFFDCPDRERAQWWGDVTVLSGQSYYQLSPAANGLVRKAIRELVDWQRDDDVLYSPVPAGSWRNELPAQMLASISTYGFWYYYMHTGDRETIEYVYPAIRRYLSLWSLDEDGLTEYRSGDWSWGDWGSDIDIRLILASWHVLALKSAAMIAQLTGNEEDVDGYAALIDKVCEAYNRCWDGTAYRHPSYDGQTDDRVNAMAVIAGIADESKYDALFELFKKEEHASPYMEKYVLEALVKTGHADYAIERFKKRFRNMIEDPLHTTLFEGWEKGGYGGGSTNHAWSGGMLTVIAENICGLRPVVPGWSRFEIRPDPVIPECDITVPSVRGMIRAAFCDTEETFILDVTIPSRTRAKIILPATEYRNITINGRTHDDDGIRLRPGKYQIICTK